MDRPAPPRRPVEDRAADAVTPDLSLDLPVDRTADEVREVLELALHFPQHRASRWHRSGLSPRGERWFDRVAYAILLLFVGSWGWTIAEARERPANERRVGLSAPTARIASALTDPRAPSAAYLTSAALASFAPPRGESGRLRAVIVDQGDALALDSVPAGASVGFADHGGAPSDSSVPPATAPAPAAGDRAVAPRASGIWQLVLAAGSALQPVKEFAVITRRPIADRRNGRVGLYFIGTWPTEQRAHAGYRTPSGFIEVTPGNQDTHVSEHFQLRDFLTKGQANVWPKYLVLDMRLVDKLELVLAELREQGVDTRGVVVMSGFRTPSYNAGGGNTAGRASLSRHMYGDASDVFIDNDGDGWMDDINRDGRRDVGDARFFAEAAERVEREHPSLVGGIGIYRPGPGHGPFVHVDTRGFRARW